MRALTLLLLVAAPVLGDVVHLQDGTKVEGKIILETEGGVLCVQLSNRSAKVLKRADVKQVERDESPLTYVRFCRYSDRWSRLEVLNRTLISADKTRRVSLVGAVHVADKTYYGRVQKILDRHDAVLYEGVGPNQDSDLGKAELPDAEQRARELKKPAKLGTLIWTDAKAKDSITLMQTSMAETLDLMFQKNGIDYSHSWWFSADVTQAQLKNLYANGQEAAMVEVMTQGWTNPELTDRMNKLVGRALAEAAKGLLSGGKSMDLVLKEACADLLATQFEQTPGQDPKEKAVTDFDRAIILGRNRVVMQRFKEMQTHPQAKTIAIFYGAGHNPDLEVQLNELGYTKLRDEWLPAWEMERVVAAEPR